MDREIDLLRVDLYNSLGLVLIDLESRLKSAGVTVCPPRLMAGDEDDFSEPVYFIRTVEVSPVLVEGLGRLRQREVLCIAAQIYRKIMQRLRSCGLLNLKVVHFVDVPLLGEPYCSLFCRMNDEVGARISYSQFTTWFCDENFVSNRSLVTVDLGFRYVL